MPATHTLKIAPSVLVWARQSLGYTIEDAAHKLNVKPEKISAWERGLASPTYTQLEGLAYKVYKRPLAVFFRSTPPVEESIEKDFRNLTSSEANHLSTEMRLVIRKAKRLQNLIKEIDSHEEPLYKAFKVTISDNPTTAANRFRKFIGLHIEDQKKWNHENSFDNFKSYIERIGIYVFQFSMPFEEARAFSLTDENPVIVLNTQDAKNGRIFSLFHEVCHILFNTGGIFRDKTTKGIKVEYKAIEDFCNEFAASVLLPDNLFKKDINFEKQKPHEWNNTELEALSRKYSVSKEVILRKLVDLNLASKSYYFARKNAWDKEIQKQKERLKQKNKDEGKSGAVPVDIRVVNERGKLYISKVLDSYEKGNLAYGNLSEFLDVKLDHLPKIIERVNK